MHQISKLTGERSESRIQRLRAFLSDLRSAQLRVLVDRLRDGIVEAAIEGWKFIDLDRRAEFVSQIRDRLTKITVVPNDLLEGVAAFLQLASVQRGACLNLGTAAAARKPRDGAALHRFGGLFYAERLDELVEKGGYTV
jgi:hypothetical protein